MSIVKKIKAKYNRSPHKSGVYIFKDSNGVPLYIGKARDLKKRLASYVIAKKHLPRIAIMLNNAKDLEWIITDNELEALILEASLIREHKPKYNSALKDDKRYPYLKITNEPFPRVIVVRRKENDGSIYFGPYADRMGAGKLSRTIRRLFPIRTCKYELPSKRKIKPCILKDIGKCLAPCDGKCSKEKYRDAVDEIVMFLRGKRTELLKKLRKQMNDYADKLQFEFASRVRDTIAELERMLIPQKMDSDVADRDFLTVAAGGGIGVGMVFRMRQGIMIARQIIPMTVPRKETIAETISEFISNFYAEDGDVPPEILVSEKPYEYDELTKYLSMMSRKTTHIKVPRRGKKYETMLLVKRNAELVHSDMILQKKKVRIPYGILELERLLNLPKTPNLIEAFDISNFGSQTIVASMVQFVHGRANRSGYRHFRIKSVSGQDDFASMREVVFRRYRRLLDENKHLPDSILIDGGKGQLSAALNSLEKLNLESKISVAALAKRLDEIFLPNQTDSIILPKDTAALRLLQRIRDEAHRFAITYSRKSHRKRMLELELTEIAGIGQKRAQRLLKEFGGLDSMAKVSVEELKSRAKIPENIAIELKKYLTEKSKIQNHNDK